MMHAANPNEFFYKGWRVNIGVFAGTSPDSNVVGYFISKGALSDASRHVLVPATALEGVTEAQAQAAKAAVDAREGGEN